MNKVCEALKNDKKVLTVFLDMSKAFDCVDHDILLEKLFAYGIRGRAHSWFKSYLSDRTQQVSFNGTFSDNICNIDCGVPQLAPLVYLIYVNDFYMCLDKYTYFVFR